jgi:hypothetical protein
VQLGAGLRRAAGMRTGIVMLLVACEADKPPPGEDDAVEGDADTDTDTDSDADTDADADTDGAPGCAVEVPADAIVVADADIVDATPDAVYWVCKSRNLSYSGTGASILVEIDGDVVLNGTGNTVWLKAGGGLALFQPENDIRYEDEGDVNDESGGPTALTSCPSLQFDYTNAPQPGCNLD